MSLKISGSTFLYKLEPKRRLQWANTTMVMYKLFYLYQLSKKVISEDFLNNYEVKTAFSSVSSLFFFLLNWWVCFWVRLATTQLMQILKVALLFGKLSVRLLVNHTLCSEFHTQLVNCQTRDEFYITIKEISMNST